MMLPETCIRRPVMTTLLMMAFVIFGMFSYRLLPVAAIPRVDFPTIVVSAQLPGASPETMASSVATPLERQFSTIAGLNSMVSTSGQGVTSITMQFDLNRDIDGAALDVQAAMTTAAKLLPVDMTTPPSFQKVNPADQPVIFLVLGSDTLPLSLLDEYAETMMSERISTLPGVALGERLRRAEIRGARPGQPGSARRQGPDAHDVQNAVAAANSDTPVGTMMGPGQSFTLQMKTSSTTPPISSRSSWPTATGAPVRLQDVATVVDSVENDQVAGWYNGQRSIILAVQRQPDANTVQVVDSDQGAVAGVRGRAARRGEAVGLERPLGVDPQFGQ